METSPQRQRDVAAALALSLFLLIPVIAFPPVSGDRPSHVYNAWLAEVVQRQHPPGLRVATMTMNILYDQLLSSLAVIAGFRAAEKIATSLVVLIFFWGMFSLVAAFSGTRPWRLVPFLAMLTFGWTFTAGFMNYFAAIGLASFGIALWCAGKPRSRWLIMPLGVLAWLAHPLGVLWLLGAIAWHEFARRTRWWWQAAAVALAVAAMFALRIWMTRHYQVMEWDAPIWRRTGVDQFWLFRESYVYVAAGVLLFVLLWLVVEVARQRSAEQRQRAAVPGGLWLLLFAAVCILPDGVVLPMYASAVTLVAARSAVLLVVLLAALCAMTTPRAWHGIGLALFAVAFFTMSFRDHARLARMDRQAQQLVQQVPEGARVVAVMFWPGSHIIIYHLPDLACIGHCFSYADYEPASQQFRVRTTGPNSLALWNTNQLIAVAVGSHVVQPYEQPIYQLYQCGASDNVCLEPLTTGERNGDSVMRKGWLATLK